MILVTGPTGSGKSTTLYATLNVVSKPEINVITVEDPVEYRLPGINQVQVNPKAGLTFARRAALDPALGPRRRPARRDPRPRDGPDRHRGRAHRPPRAVDPAHQRRPVGDHPADRDGHRAVPRRLGAGLRARPAAGAPAVRQVRRGVHARAARSSTPRGSAWPATSRCPTLWRPVGCPPCSRTGYKGRLALHEVMTVTEEIERLAVTRASAHRDRPRWPASRG